MVTADKPRTILVDCPTECGDPSRVVLSPTWQQEVVDGASLPVVGCGNPWHYLSGGILPAGGLTSHHLAMGQVTPDGGMPYYRERPGVSTQLFAYLLVAFSGMVVGFAGAAFLGVFS